MCKGLCLKAVRKSYGSKTVLDNLTCDFSAGKLYALLGENGAGKSTLAALICGEKIADSGCIEFKGMSSYALVHQRPLLAGRLNVRDNIILGSEPVFSHFFGCIDFKRAENRIKELVREWELPIEMHACVSRLSAQERFYTAFAAALYKNPDILILDEPGAVLNSGQKQSLYPALKAFCAPGKIVIVITHDINDALAYADSVIVLRSGHKAAFLNCAAEKNGTCTNLNTDYLSSLVFGTAHGKTVPDKPQPPLPAGGKDGTGAKSGAEKHGYEKPVLSVEHVSCTPGESAALYNIHFTVFPGSITCIHGYRENGLETLENLLTGSGTLDYTGRIMIGDTELNAGTASRAEQIKNSATGGIRVLRTFGAGVVPFNRTFRASNPALTVEQMLTVYIKPDDTVKSADYARLLVSRAGINIGIEEKTASLSGGMLQRLIIEREMDYHKKLLILFEPERGLDAGAAADLAQRLQCAAEKGTGILLCISAGNPALFESRFRYSITGGHLYET